MTNFKLGKQICVPSSTWDLRNQFIFHFNNFESLLRTGSQKIALFLNLSHHFVSLVRPGSQKIPLFLNLSHNFVSLVRPGSQKITRFLYLGHNFVSLFQLGYMKKWTFIMLVNKGHKNTDNLSSKI